MSRTTTSSCLGIGALARLAGVAPETIRSWERRYGFPAGDRLPSGHRRYPAGVVERIRLIRRALSLGIRAGKAVPADPHRLSKLVEAASPRPVLEIQNWLEAARRLSGDALEASFRAAYLSQGAAGFVRRAALPFLEQVGSAWRTGRLSVAAEHLASERLAGFLAARWRPLSDAAQGRPVLLATLPGETHTLGLHLGALVLAEAGIPVVLLGNGCPIGDLVAAARTRPFLALLVSISQAAPKAKSRRWLAELAAGLATPPLLVGSPWPPPRSCRARWLRDFDDLEAWVAAAAPGSRKDPP